MKDGWKNKTMWTFIGGAATALAGSKFLKSNTAHDLAVKGLAGGNRIQLISMRQLRKTQRIY